MAMGRQKDGQGDLMVSWSEMPRALAVRFAGCLGHHRPSRFMRRTT